MPTALSALRKQIVTAELKPVYLLAGEEHLLLLEAADALRARARELGYSEREVLDVESNFDWNALSQSASSMSLFATRKLGLAQPPLESGVTQVRAQIPELE